MLSYLTIDNMAVIKHTEIEFSEGLNILTGETGAGKSVIIGAISMALGKRMTKDIIRTGEEKAAVSALFYPDEKQWNALAEAEIEQSEDGSLLVYREINENGRGICKINGSVVTASQLKDVGNLLINVHGQQDTAVLYSPDKHLGLLDSWAGEALAKEKTKYLEVFEVYKSLKSQIMQIEKLKTDRDREMDILDFQIKELEALSPQIGELDTITSRLDVLKNSEKITKALHSAYKIFVSDSNSVADMLHTAASKLKLVGGVSDGIDSLLEKITDIAYTADDIASEIIAMQGEMAYSESELEELHQRAYEIKTMCAKYKCNEEGLVNYLQQAHEKLEKLNNIDLQYENLKTDFRNATDKIQAISDNMHDLRVRNGLVLEKELEKELSELNMPGCKFKIELSQTENYTPDGRTSAAFYISPNAGEELKPLAKIASGGELSRIMLALKSIISSYDIVDTYIFDEIDTGISGKTAEKVAEKLMKVAKNNQTIIITHSPHIAAIADSHFLISKNMSLTETKTEVKKLDKSGRISEIARINSGSNITQTAVMHAEELLESAQKRKQQAM